MILYYLRIIQVFLIKCCAYLFCITMFFACPLLLGTSLGYSWYILGYFSLFPQNCFYENLHIQYILDKYSDSPYTKNHIGVLSFAGGYFHSWYFSISFENDSIFFHEILQKYFYHYSDTRKKIWYVASNL